MLQKVCEYLHNYFVKDAIYGKYTVSESSITPALHLKNGQRFLIHGSDMNDGVYTFHECGISNDDDDQSAELNDETFEGYICAMAIPREIDNIVREISEWQTKNAAVLDSPYTSESFGGYSYTKATGSGEDAGSVITWQSKFRNRLNAYRKI